MSIARRGKGKEIAREGIFHEIDANNQVLIPPAVVVPLFDPSIHSICDCA